MENMLVNNVYGRFASFFKNHELKEEDEYIKRVFPNAELYLDYEHALVFERIGEDGKPIKGTGRMIKDWFEFERDGNNIPKIHPTQKPVNLLKQLIEIYTDEGDVVIDPVAGSCSTLRACAELKRNCYGFEIKKNFYNEAKEKMLSNIETQLF